VPTATGSDTVAAMAPATSPDPASGTSAPAPTSLARIEQAFWRYRAIRLNAAGKRVLVTDRVPGPLLKSYRATGGSL
jgi:hypothetical protein